MKARVPLLLGLLLIVLPVAGQNPADWSRPGQAAVHADHMDGPADSAPSDVQLQAQPRQTDPAQLKREAQELAKRAEAVSAQIDQIAKGKLPKDLNAQLKQIEKLSKQLRREIFH